MATIGTTMGGKGLHWYTVTIAIPARTAEEAKKTARTIIGNRHIAVVSVKRGRPVS